MTIRSELQVLEKTSPVVELYTLDCSGIGGTIYYFTPNVYPDGTPVVWKTHSYTFIPIATEGWQVSGGTSSGSTTQPTPTLTISNVNKILLNAVVTLGDITGAKLTRYITLQKFLDGQPSADQTQFIGPDVYYVYAKTAHNRNSITWQMINPIDAPGKFLPVRQALRTTFPGLTPWNQ